MQDLPFEEKRVQRSSLVRGRLGNARWGQEKVQAPGSKEKDTAMVAYASDGLGRSYWEEVRSEGAVRRKEPAEKPARRHGEPGHPVEGGLGRIQEALVGRSTRHWRPGALGRS